MGNLENRLSRLWKGASGPHPSGAQQKSWRGKPESQSSGICMGLSERWQSGRLRRAFLRDFGLYKSLRST